jgi:hypothetical protein
MRMATTRIMKKRQEMDWRREGISSMMSKVIDEELHQRIPLKSGQRREGHFWKYRLAGCGYSFHTEEVQHITGSEFW